jgi:hypothetical protein
VKLMSVFAVKCELCKSADALDHCRLCEACTDAIVRLISVLERISAQRPSTANCGQMSSDSQSRGIIPASWPIPRVGVRKLSCQ